MTAPSTVTFLPLDDRPPNYEFPALLAAAADLNALLPPKAWLGTPWREGDVPQIADWLAQVAPQADALIVALDTLGYGGLVNSRRSTESAETALQRLALLRTLKQQQPDLVILAYSVLMRISRHNSAEEEKDYWGTYGERLFRLSYLEDRRAMLAGQPEDDDAIAQLHAAIPGDILADYRQGRARNHEVNCAMIDWTAEGIFDYLIIPQDDTVEYGWNIAERRRLQQRVHRLNAAGRVSIYPGADEIDMLLLARFVAMRANLRPRVHVAYSSVLANQVVTAYEDRPMEEMIKAHLGPLDGALAPTPDHAHIHLYVNSPAVVQGEGYRQYALTYADSALDALPPAAKTAMEAIRQQAESGDTLRELHAAGRNVEEFARRLADDVAAGIACAVVDVAYVNGGDLALCSALRRQLPLAQLAAYGGWNTAGNTLGTVLAQSVIRCLQIRDGASPAALAAHAQFLFLRWVDDVLYQGLVRSQVMLEDLPAMGEEPRMSDLGAAAPTVASAVQGRLAAEAARLADEHFRGRTVASADSAIRIEQIGLEQVLLPWRRLFEVHCPLTIDASVQPLTANGHASRAD